MIGLRTTLRVEFGPVGWRGYVRETDCLGQVCLGRRGGVRSQTAKLSLLGVVNDQDASKLIRIEPEGRSLVNIGDGRICRRRRSSWTGTSPDMTPCVMAMGVPSTRSTTPAGRAVVSGDSARRSLPRPRRGLEYGPCGPCPRSRWSVRGS